MACGQVDKIAPKFSKLYDYEMPEKFDIWKIIFFSLLLLSFSLKAENKDICTDLFKASCLGPDGKNKFGEKAQLLDYNALKIITDARDKTAKDLGYESFEDGLKKKLAEADLNLKTIPDQTAWFYLKNGYFVKPEFVADVDEKLFLNVNYCTKNAEDLQIKQNIIYNDMDELNRMEEETNDFQNKYNEKMAKFYADDVSSFISIYIREKCGKLKNMSEKYSALDNKKAFDICQNTEKLRREATRLHLIEGTPQYQKEAEKFISENLSPPLISSTPFIYGAAVPSPYSSNSYNRSPFEEKKELVQKRFVANSNLCADYATAVRSSATKVTRDFMIEINTAKTTVDYVIDHVYTDAYKKQASKIFLDTKTEIQDIARHFVKDPQKKSDILTGYDSMDFLMMEKPENNAYKKSPKGNLVLDPEKSLPEGLGGYALEPIAIFNDPSLSFFTQLNADYFWTMALGKYSFQERVKMMPKMMLLAKDNPQAFEAVLAHEVGHRIGPNSGRINGFDLNMEYRELLECYRSQHSIKMQKGQEDETIADYISSEDLARSISRLPKDQREAHLISSMEFFCMYDNTKNSENIFQSKIGHPLDSLRVSRIYGANPNLRNAIGCESDSPNFRTCGIKDLTLPIALEAVPRSSLRKDAETSQGAK